jgi:hypothetical protein
MVEKKEKTIEEKLQLVQVKLKAPKSQFNKFAGFNYRNLEDILTAVKPLLDKTDCSLTLSDEPVLIADRIYIRATAVFSDGKNQLITTAYAREPLSKKGMDESKITGSTSSYARKYCLNGLFLIDDTKDADTQNNKDMEPRINQSQYNALKLVLAQGSSTLLMDQASVYDDVVKQLDIRHKSNELTIDEYGRVMNSIREKIQAVA